MPLARVCGHTFMEQLLGQDSVVLDLGAHYGAFSHQLIDRYRCRCVAVEGNPAVCEGIAAAARLTVINRVVSAGSGREVPFYVYDRLESSSAILRSDRGPAHEIQVASTTLADLLESYADPFIDLLKLDIEGAEIDALDGCPDRLLGRIRQATVEFHDFNGVVSKNEVKRVISRMRSLGFHVVTMWMRSHGDTLFVHRDVMGSKSLDLAWSRYVVRHWWWSKRFVARIMPWQGRTLNRDHAFLGLASSVGAPSFSVS